MMVKAQSKTICLKARENMHMKASFTPKTHILLTLLWLCATPWNPNSSLKMALHAHISGMSYDVPVTQKFKCILTFIKSIKSPSIT